MRTRWTYSRGVLPVAAWNLRAKVRGLIATRRANCSTAMAPVAAVDGDDKIGGYAVMQAESAAALDKLLKDHPHRLAPGASIAVHEFLPMPGM